MKMSRWIVRVALALAGVSCLGLSAWADVYLPRQGRGVPTIKSAADAEANIPFLRKLSRSFLIGDGFRFKLTGMELRIDHMGAHSSAPANKRNCLIGFSYASPVAFFGSRIDVPLFHADSLKSAWGANTPGDYVLHFSKDSAVQHPVLGLMATARF
jgi:hypothetical protein